MRRMLSAAAAGLVILMVLAGCAGAAPALTASVSSELQTSVRSVALAASSGNYSGAAAKLATLQNQLDAAEDAHHVSADRALQIQAMIDAVKADLAKLAASVPVTSSPTPTPTPTVVTPPGPGKGPKPGKPGHGHNKP